MSREDLIDAIIEDSEGEYTRKELQDYCYDELVNLWYQY